MHFLETTYKCITLRVIHWIFLYIQWPRSLVLNLACSAWFFSRNSVFLSQQFSRNSGFQSVSVKIQTSERGHTDFSIQGCVCLPWRQAPTSIESLREASLVGSMHSNIQSHAASCGLAELMSLAWRMQCTRQPTPHPAICPVCLSLFRTTF